MKEFRKGIAYIIFCVTALIASAQPGWEWGDQPDVAKEKNALYTDQIKANNFQGALEPLNWLYDNTPDLHVSIYQNGAKLYRSLASKEIDEEKKSEYIRLGLDLFDKRIKYFQKEAYVTDRKVNFAYKFYNKDRTKYEYLYELFTNDYELNSSKMIPGNLVAFMNVVYKFRTIKGDISDEKVLEIYSNISDALNLQKAKVAENKQPKYDKMIDQVTKLLTATIDLNCDLVKNVLGPKLETENEDEKLKWAKKIFQLLLSNKCTDTPLAVESAMFINEKEPDYGVSLFIAKKEVGNENLERALAYFNKALTLTQDNIKQADIYLDIAKINVKEGKKIDARSNARKALAYDPSRKDAYRLIGNLYMTSYEQCRADEFKVVDRAIFIAAYNQFVKSGDSQLIKVAAQQFPTIEDIFNENYQEGQTVTVGCWVNETISVKRRQD